MRHGTVFNRSIMEIAASLDEGEETNGFVVVEGWTPSVRERYRCEKKTLLNRDGHLVILTRYLDEYPGQFQMYWDLATKTHPLPEWMSSPLPTHKRRML